MSVEKPQNRDELIENALMRLGQPVTQVNVTKEQCVIRANDAIRKYREYSYKASENVWVGHEITDQEANTAVFNLDEDIIDVKSVLGIRRSNFGIDGHSNHYHQFDLLHELNRVSYMGANKLDVYLYQRERSELDSQFSPPEQFDYNPVTRRLQIRIDDQYLIAGNYIMYNANMSIENITSDFYADDWLAKYTSSLIQEQWGENLGKFTEISLPGGYTMNGDQIYQKSKDKQTELLDELHEEFSFGQVEMSIG